MQSALRKFVAPVVFTTGLLMLSEPVSFAQEVKPDQVLTPQEPAKDVARVHDLLNPNEEASQTPAPYTPITLKQKYEYSLEQMFSGPRLLAILAHTGIDQAEVSCAIEILSDSEAGGVHKLELDWIMNLKSMGDNITLERRREQVKIEMRQIKGKWKITAMAPLSILDPIHII